MKNHFKYILLLALGLYGSGLLAQWGNNKVVGNGQVTTRTVNTGDYHSVQGVGSMDIHLQRGTEGAITVKTDQNLQEYVIVEENDGVLKIRTRKKSYLKSKKGIHVYVPFQELDAVSLTGSGDLSGDDTLRGSNLEVRVTGSGDVDLDVGVQNLEVVVTGSGDMELSGSATNLEVTVSGSGDFKGFDLQADNTDVRVAGSGDARVVAKTSLNARVSGSGGIVYRGDPGQKDSQVSGSGKIKAQ